MSLALRSRAPFVLSRLQVPVQVALYAGLFLVAQWVVVQFHLPLPANIVGMLMLLAMIVLRVCGGCGRELCLIVNDRRLADFCRYCGKHYADARVDCSGCG